MEKRRPGRRQRSVSDPTSERVRDGTDENFTICPSRQEN